MRAACVIEHIEDESMHGCGLYYEIYHYRVICRLLQLLQPLNGTDRIKLTEESNRRGFTLDETCIKESRHCYSDIIREIHESHY